MKLQPKITIADHFSDLEYPRIERTKHHQLIDIITLSLCAVICGADTWVDIESYGRAKYQYFGQFWERDAIDSSQKSQWNRNPK
ncbi:transposase family protein, partial [Microcoleus sp. C2C3]|uniref:transposase family protein n=1 Tax=unclassified Microcoleus TaxID=2642155 RepID=UPI002FD74DA5